MSRNVGQITNDLAKKIQERFEVFTVEQLRQTAEQDLERIQIVVLELVDELSEEDKKTFTDYAQELVPIYGNESDPNALNEQIFELVFFAMSRLQKIES